MNAMEELLALRDEEQAKHLMRFFKTDKGQYGEGDKFLGIRVPQNRLIAKKYYKNISFTELQTMLNNQYHEIRLCALLMMVYLYERTDKKDKIVKLYLRNVRNINNWDLVDLTAPKILGAHYLKTRDSSDIRRLADSEQLWAERIAVVSQWTILKEGEFKLLISLCEKFLGHKHDLMHKAVGWMLREAGKKDKEILLHFLDKHAKAMPRTALRYSIEKLTPAQRKFYMSK
ncbi:DNA alkylation repair protein [bacterium]|nr:DNA alkylation repair protein [bacterium]